MDDTNCSVQFGENIVPLRIQSVDHKDYQSIYKVTNDSWELLPQKLVIKTRPSNSDAYYIFDMEAKVYSLLSDFQGQLIPRYWGVAKFHHAKMTVDAHVIEQIDGTPLTEFAGDISESKFKTKIFQAYNQLSKRGVVHGDVELRHIYIVGPQQTLTLIDFGLAMISEDTSKAESQNSADVEELFTRYKLCLESQRMWRNYLAGGPNGSSAQAPPLASLPDVSNEACHIH